MRAGLIFLLLALVTVFAACERTGGFESRAPANGETDWCGYTWTRIAPPAASINIVHTPDWRDMPGTCRHANIRGCADTYTAPNGTRHVTIHTIDPPAQIMATAGQCNALVHEMWHALGLTHAEDEAIYQPKDFATGRR